MAGKIASAKIIPDTRIGSVMIGAMMVLMGFILIAPRSIVMEEIVTAKCIVWIAWDKTIVDTSNGLETTGVMMVLMAFTSIVKSSIVMVAIVIAVATHLQPM